MNGTLPLFQELEAPAESQAGPGAPAPARQPARRDADRHLRAAWRLSRAMRRFPDRSPEQTRAGLAICRHLQALLTEDESNPPRSR